MSCNRVTCVSSRFQSGTGVRDQEWIVLTIEVERQLPLCVTLGTMGGEKNRHIHNTDGTGGGIMEGGCQKVDDWVWSGRWLLRSWDAGDGGDRMLKSHLFCWLLSIMYFFNVCCCNCPINLTISSVSHKGICQNPFLISWHYNQKGLHCIHFKCVKNMVMWE